MDDINFYEVSVICNNCGHTDEIQPMQGVMIESLKCDNCGCTTLRRRHAPRVETSYSDHDPKLTYDYKLGRTAALNEVREEIIELNELGDFSIGAVLALLTNLEKGK